MCILNQCYKKSIWNTKETSERRTLMSIDEDQNFVVERENSNEAISDTLNQNGKSVAFISGTLN